MQLINNARKNISTNLITQKQKEAKEKLRKLEEQLSIKVDQLIKESKNSEKIKEAHYWSRSRKCIWKKGETSGLIQKIKEIKIDDDQDCVIFKVALGGLKASCHVGYKSCFYRKITLEEGQYIDKLEFTEKEKVFDPQEIYGNAPNPTKL